MKSQKKRPASKKRRRPKGPKKSIGPRVESSREFTESDLVDDLWKTMRNQEKANPAIALLHERLEGSFKLVGLTGGIASGKSTLSKIFEEAGVPVIDADQVARDIVKPGSKAHKAILEKFGREILLPNKEIDRPKLASIVFSDPARCRELETITHPEIFRQIARRIRTLKKERNPKIIVVDAALLFESELFKNMDRIVLVKTPPEIQRKRLMERDGMTEIEAQRRIASQMPDEEKEKLSNFVLDNSGTKEDLKQEALEVLVQLRELG